MTGEFSTNAQTDDDGALNRRSGRSALVGVGWVSLQKWFASIAQLVTFVLLARLLAPDAFGLAAQAAVFVTLLGAVADAGFGQYVITYPKLTRRQLSTVFWTSNALAVLLAGGLVASAGWIAVLYGEPAVAPVLRVLALSLPITALASVPTALLSRELHFRPLAVRTLVATSLGAVVAIVAAFMGAGVWALVMQTLVIQVVGVVLVWAAVDWRPSFAYSKHDVKEISSFSARILGIAVVHQMRDRGDELVIGIALGVEALGYWVIATKIIRMVIDIFASVIQTVALPAFARAASEMTRLTHSIRAAINGSAAVTVPAMAGLAVVSPVLIPFIFGEQWQDSVIPAQLMAMGAMVTALQWFDGSVWVALRKPGTDLVLTLIISVVHIAVTLTAAPYGLTVLAAALLGRTLLLAPLRAFVLHYRGRIPWSIYADLPRIGLAVLMMAGAAYGMLRLLADAQPPVQLAASIATGLVAYVLTLTVVARRVIRPFLDNILRTRRQHSRKAESLDVLG